MDCIRFREMVVEIAGSGSATAEMEEHMKECPECRAYYKRFAETVDLLTPKHMPAAHAKRKPARSRFVRTVGSAAAAVMIFIAGAAVGYSEFMSTGAKADPIGVLDNGIYSVGNVGNMEIDMAVRTYPNENFESFFPESGFISHKLKVVHQGDSLYWRLDREGGRHVVFDSHRMYMWPISGHYGVIAGKDGNIVDGVFKDLIHPEQILGREKKRVSSDNGDGCLMEKTGNEIKLDVSESPEQSGEPAFRREYVFDVASGLLKSFRMWQNDGEKDVLVMYTVSIRYNIPIDLDSLKSVPFASYDWQHCGQWNAPHAGHAGESAEDAARRMINALITGEKSGIDGMISSETFSTLHDIYASYTISSVGTPERDESYCGVKVPFKLKDGSGNVKELYIMLRNDNEKGIWIFDGGL